MFEPSYWNMITTLNDDVLFDLVVRFCSRIDGHLDITAFSNLLQCSRELRLRLTHSYVATTLVCQAGKNAVVRQRFLARGGHSQVLRALLCNDRWRLRFKRSAEILHIAIWNGYLGYARLLLSVLKTRFKRDGDDIDRLLSLWKVQFISCRLLAGVMVCEKLGVKFDLTHLVAHREGDHFPERLELYDDINDVLMSILQRTCFSPTVSDDLTFEYAIRTGDIDIIKAVGNRRCAAADRDPCRYDITIMSRRNTITVVNYLLERGEIPGIEQLFVAVDQHSRCLRALIEYRLKKRVRDYASDVTRCLSRIMQNGTVRSSHLSMFLNSFPSQTHTSAHLRLAILHEAWKFATDLVEAGVALNDADATIVRSWSRTLDFREAGLRNVIKLIKLGGVVLDEALYEKVSDRKFKDVFVFLMGHDRAFLQWLSSTDEHHEKLRMVLC